MNSNLKKTIGTTFITLAIFSACKKDPNPQNSTSNGSTSGYSSGIFITNEGPFGAGSGTVSFFNRNTGAVTNDIFQTANSIPLGNIVHSMGVMGSKGYVVVNNANKVEVVTLADFKSVGTISNISMPRYFIGVSSTKGYVTQWTAGGFGGAVAIVDLSTNTVTKTIATGVGADRMLMSGGKVYVACSGGFDKDSVVSVIDYSNDSLIQNMVVGHNPNSMEVDMNGKMWVLCGGINDWMTPANSTAGKLVRVNLSTHSVEASYSFSSNSDHPSNLVINANGDKLFYLLNGSMFSFDISSNSISTSSIVSKNFYGLGYDKTSNYLFGSDAGNFSNEGYVYRFNSTNYSLVDSFKVGVIPGNFVFN